jgi:hypothetical protein
MTTELTKKELNETEVNLLISLMSKTYSVADKDEIKKTLKKLIDNTKFQSDTYYAIVHNFNLY